MKIVEGLAAGDLADLVLPVVSIDEFESKIDDDAVVVGFYVKHELAAKDLNRFIQKSAMAILDTEVSVAANENGYFMVFVEILRNTETENKILSIIADVTALTNIEDWQFTYYKHEKVFKLDKTILHVLLRTDPKPNAEEDLAESLKSFVSNSNVRTLSLNEGNVIIGDGRSTHRFKTTLYESFDEFSKHYQHVSNMNFRKDFDFMVENLQRIFGHDYAVYKAEEGYAVVSETGKTAHFVL